MSLKSGIMQTLRHIAEIGKNGDVGVSVKETAEKNRWNPNQNGKKPKVYEVA